MMIQQKVQLLEHILSKTEDLGNENKLNHECENPYEGRKDWYKTEGKEKDYW